MEDLTNSNPDNGTSATSTLTPESTTGTVQPNGDANGAQSASVGEDNFTKVDPRTLPPQLKSTYDNMLKDYKEKTTKLSETIKSESAKAAEAYKSKAELYDSIAQQEEFVKRWNAYVEETQKAPQGAESAGDPVLTEMKQKLDAMSQKIQLSEMTQVTESFAEAVNEKGEKIHPDFDQLNDLVIGRVQNGKGAEEFSLLRACIELSQGQSPQEKLANGYKAAKELHDKVFEMGKKAGMGRLQSKVLNGTNPPSNSSGDLLSVTDKKPKNAHEAMAMAKRGQVVSRD